MSDSLGNQMSEFPALLMTNARAMQYHSTHKCRIREVHLSYYRTGVHLMGQCHEIFDYFLAEKAQPGHHMNRQKEFR